MIVQKKANFVFNLCYVLKLNYYSLFGVRSSPVGHQYMQHAVVGLFSLESIDAVELMNLCWLSVRAGDGQTSLVRQTKQHLGSDL
jgi:hypothetical protein